MSNIAEQDNQEDILVGHKHLQHQLRMEVTENLSTHVAYALPCRHAEYHERESDKLEREEHAHVLPETC